MIINLWQKIRLFCGNHEEMEGKSYPHMTPHAAAESETARAMYGNSTMNMFYSCPKYYPDGRDENEPACRNHISMKEFEGMLDKIASEIEKAQRNDTVTDLVGMRWKSKSGVEYRIIRSDDEHIDVVCLNPKSLWK